MLAKKKKIICLIAAPEDAGWTDRLGQVLGEAQARFEFAAMPRSETLDPEWEATCTRLLRGSHGALVLLSEHTSESPAARRQIGHAIDECVPCGAVRTAECEAPPELQGKPVTAWNARGISDLLEAM